MLSHPRPYTLPASQSAHTSASLAFFRDPTAHSHAALSALPSQPSPPSACTPVCRSLPKHDLLALSARVLSPPLPVSSTRCPAPSSLTETHTSSVSTGFTRVQVKQYLLSCQLTASTSVSSPPHSHLASSPHPHCLFIPSSPPPSASSFVILPSLPTLVRHAVLSTLSLTLASHLRASTLSSLSSTMSPVPSLPHCRLPALSRALCSHHPGLPLPPPKSPFSTSGVCSHIHFVLSQLRMPLCLTLIRWCADTLCVINPLLQYTTSSCLLPSPPHSSMASLARWYVSPLPTLADLFDCPTSPTSPSTSLLSSSSSPACTLWSPISIPSPTISLIASSAAASHALPPPASSGLCCPSPASLVVCAPVSLCASSQFSAALNSSWSLSTCSACRSRSSRCLMSIQWRKPLSLSCTLVLSFVQMHLRLFLPTMVAISLSEVLLFRVRMFWRLGRPRSSFPPRILHSFRYPCV